MRTVKAYLICLFAICVMLAFVVHTAFAAPSLPVTKPPVVPNVSWTGPIQDPHALQGQWFKGVGAVGTETVRTHEFYDNVLGFGGGNSGFNAIRGQATNIQYLAGPGTPITAFDVSATITNDAPAQTSWQPGTNSHGETLTTTTQYVGRLFQTKLSASFAIDQAVGPGPGNISPYVDQNPHIVALNHDELAWYCWTPNNPEPSKVPWGAYYVPTWDFGDIPLGFSAARTMKFSILEPAGLTPADPRYAVLVNSQNQSADMFFNRTTSLKISDWQDTIAIDAGVPYPSEPFHGSDVSVFHAVPEPGTVVMLLCGALTGLGVWLRRRGRK